MGSRPHGPEPCASTNSATAAGSDMVAGGTPSALTGRPLRRGRARLLQDVLHVAGMVAGTTTRFERMSPSFAPEPIAGL